MTHFEKLSFCSGDNFDVSAEKEVIEQQQHWLTFFSFEFFFHNENIEFVLANASIAKTNS